VSASSVPSLPREGAQRTVNSPAAQDARRLMWRIREMQRARGRLEVQRTPRAGQRAEPGAGAPHR